MEDSLDPEDEDAVGHPAFAHQPSLAYEPGEAFMIWQCKHCDAWKPMTDEDLDGGEMF